VLSFKLASNVYAWQWQPNLRVMHQYRSWQIFWVEVTFYFAFDGGFNNLLFIGE